jgi:MoxR-like ATPase
MTNKPIVLEVRKTEFGDYEYFDAFDGNKVKPTFPVPDWLNPTAYRLNLRIQLSEKNNGEKYWKKLDKQAFTALKATFGINPPIVKEPEVSTVKKTEIKTLEALLSASGILPYQALSDEEINDLVSNAIDLKPNDIFIKDTKWKYLVRSALRGKNIMMVGDSGAGKTVTAYALARVLHRPFEKFNIGATQDARATLIGNTHANGDGTVFDESLFVKMLRTKGAIILLDEFTRGSHDAWNILMPVLDPSQRYLRLDEKAGQETVNVAEGVSFISTANIGRQFTATKMLDMAIFERNSVIEMDILSTPDEESLLKIKYPNVEPNYAEAVAKIAGTSRANAKLENTLCEKYISTRMDVELMGLIADGFTMPEAYDACVFPFFSTDGGAESERTIIAQIAQQHMITPTVKKVKKKLFSDDEMENAPI